jgi:hypothetical protein
MLCLEDGSHAQQAVLVWLTGPTLQKHPAEHFLVRPQRDFLEIRVRGNAHAPQQREVEQPELRVIHIPKPKIVAIDGGPDHFPTVQPHLSASAAASA